MSGSGLLARVEPGSAPAGAVDFDYTDRDVILYALGCGAGADELSLLCELAGLRALTTFATVPMARAVTATLDALGVDQAAVLHTGQTLHRRAALSPVGGRLRTTVTVDSRSDRGDDALLRLRATVRDEAGAALADGVSSLLCRGYGGFGGGPEPAEPAPKQAEPEPAEPVPPTWRAEVSTAPTQALLFRLNGDRNPIHALPAAAARLGHPRPLLHGLCTYGCLGLLVVRQLCDGDPDRLVGLDVRFSGPAYPGDTLRCEGWSLTGDRYGLRMRRAEDDRPVLTRAEARLTPAAPSPDAAERPAPGTATSPAPDAAERPAPGAATGPATGGRDEEIWL